jgi:hypothetical protein
MQALRELAAVFLHVVLKFTDLIDEALGAGKATSVASPIGERSSYRLPSVAKCDLSFVREMNIAHRSSF